MRNAFADEINKIAQEDPSVVLLSGDIGNRLFDTYKENHKDRFINCGVAEANMITLGAGMALSGMTPVAYTIASFLIYRAYEQIRVDVAYHNLPFLLVGVGGGLSYSSNGATHHTLEDIAIMRALPGMQVICAGDAMEVRAATRAAIQSKKPTYLRIGKKREPVIHQSPLTNFEIGKAIQVKRGEKVALLVTGNLLPNVVEATDLLKEKGINPSIYSHHTVKPLDLNNLEHSFKTYDHVFSIEEHSLIGGFGSAIAEWKCRQINSTCSFSSIGTPDTFLHKTGDQDAARELTGLTTKQIAEQIIFHYSK